MSVRRYPRARPSPSGLAWLRDGDVLLFVDLFDDFGHEDGDRLLLSLRERHAHMRALLAQSRAHGMPVVYANDNRGHWHGNALTLVEQALQGPAGALLAPLVPVAGDRFVVKPRYSAFAHTPLALILEQLDADRLLVAGMATEMCVAQTAIAARQLGLRVGVVPAACACIDEGHEATALEYLERVAGVERLELPH